MQSIDWAAVRGWISSIGIVTILGLIFRREIQMKKLGNDEKADIRDHYADELRELRAQLIRIEAHYRGMLEKSDARHDECQRDRDELRDRLNKQSQHLNTQDEEIRGLKRQIADLSTDRFTILDNGGLSGAPETRRAVKRRGK